MCVRPKVVGSTKAPHWVRACRQNSLVCLYKIGVANNIIDRRRKYRQCFMELKEVLAKDTGTLGKVKPNKEDGVKWLHWAWMKGGPLFNGAVLLVGYLHLFKGGRY